MYLNDTRDVLCSGEVTVFLLGEVWGSRMMETPANRYQLLKLSHI
jgi:hypothetical protein